MLLISTSSLKGYWIHKIFSIVKNSNYDWIDLSVDFDDFDSFDKDYLKQISDDFWVKILSITAPPRWMTKEKNRYIIWAYFCIECTNNYFFSTSYSW